MCTGGKNGTDSPKTNFTYFPLQGQASLSSPLQTVRTATPGILHPSLGTLDGGGQELPREGTAKSYQDGFRAQEQHL